MTFLSGWTRRKSKTVNGTTFGPQTDYILQLNIFKGSGTDTSTNIYLNGKCNDDFSDIRFTSSDGTTLLSYYIETVSPGIFATISIKIDTIPESPNSSTIYIYYDNPIATSESNADNTYLLYDDFDSTLDTNKWQILSGNIITGFSALQVVDPDGIVVTNNSIPINCEISYWFSWIDNTIEETVRDIKLTKETTQRDICRYSMRTGPQLDRSTIEGTFQTFPRPTYTYDINPNYDFVKHTIRHTLNGNWEFIVGNTPVHVQSSIRIPTDVFYLHFKSGASQNTMIDAVRIRKYASPEPTFGDTGPEETQLPANIVATSIILTPDICIEPCDTTVDVTYENFGQLSGTFTPEITIDGTPITIAQDTLAPSQQINKTFTLTNMSNGNYSICALPSNSPICQTLTISKVAESNIGNIFMAGVALGLILFGTQDKKCENGYKYTKVNGRYICTK